MEKRTPVFAANWKMNKLISDCGGYVERLKALLADGPASLGTSYEVILVPAATHLSTMKPLLEGTAFKLGAQNCGNSRFGAFTGETSPAVLKELGAHWVILGHSERRHFYKEDDFLILSRMIAAFEEGLSVILCVGEVLQDRKADKTFKTIETQLSILRQTLIQAPFYRRLILAYEPVWAIGTGENATAAQVQEVHGYIRNWFSEKCSSEEAPNLRILYGGSVKPENSANILLQKDVDGLLVGGASLDPVVFSNVIKNGLKNRN